MLGALLEKERTVPDTYPMTLKAVVSACNQTSSRWPVVAYDEGDEPFLDILTGKSFKDHFRANTARVTHGYCDNGLHLFAPNHDFSPRGAGVAVGEGGWGETAALASEGRGEAGSALVTLPRYSSGSRPCRRWSNTLSTALRRKSFRRVSLAWKKRSSRRALLAPCLFSR